MAPFPITLGDPDRKARYSLKIGILAYPTSIRPPPCEGSTSEYRHKVWCAKTRMVWLSHGGKCLTRFDRIHERDRRTHRRTDGIGRACIVSRGKNCLWYE